jgi:hypothetical protein
MRFDIAKDGSGLVYEIRHIVAVAQKMKEYGMEVIWENIGDPVDKGEKIPDWMKDVLTGILREDISYAYSPTQGMNEARELRRMTSSFLTGLVMQLPGLTAPSALTHESSCRNRPIQRIFWQRCFTRPFLQTPIA